MMEPARYLALYLAPVAPGATGDDAVLPTLELRHWYLGEGEVETPPLSLPQLFSAGVECGHTEARAELKRRVAVVNAQLEEYRTVRDKAQDDREQLAADLLLSQRAVVTMQMTHWRLDATALWLIAGSGLIHVGYFFLLLRGYRVGDLSLVYPVARGTGPLLATAGAVVLFGEHPTALSMTGALLVVVGVAVMTQRGAGEARIGPGVRYGLATGVAIAIYTLWDGWAVKRAGVPPLVFYWGGEVVRVLALSPLALRQPAEVGALWRSQRWRVLGIALLSPLSYILILLALRRGDVGHIAPAREVSILIGAWRAPTRRVGPDVCWARATGAGDSWRRPRSRAA